MRLRFALLLLAAALPLVSACHKGDPVQERLETLRKAIESRDAEEAGKSLAPDFRGSESSNRDEAVGELRRVLFGYENIQLSFSEMEVHRTEDHGSADFVATATGSPKTMGGLDSILPRRSRLRFHVTLRTEGSDWLIDSATFERLE